MILIMANEGKEDVFKLLRLVLAGKELFELRVHRLACEALGFPLGVFIQDECLYFLPGGGRQASVGLLDDLSQTLFIRRNAKYGFFYTQSLEEFRRHNAVRSRLGCQMRKD